ncbi:MAG: outer membrane lipoprotein-sorting protein [Halobacteriovorax sp.]|nr:outer membrane lipoprotein-sorting protein [Halobacteriovorax sp.]
MRFLAFSCLISLLFAPVMSATPEQKGLEIAKQVRDKNNGFAGEESKMKMVLITASGQQVVREMDGKVHEGGKDGDRSLMEFQNPKDVKGTKMLTWSYKNKEDDQWLYIPAFRRVKRINSSSKSSSFMGSEFAFEDLGSQEIEKFNYKWLRDEKVDKRDVWVLERVSKEPSGYSKQIMYMDKQIFNPMKIEYYNQRGELLKTAEFSAYKQYTIGSKKLYRANKIHMKNAQTKKESIFTWDNRVLGKKFPESDFSQSRLK